MVRRRKKIYNDFRLLCFNYNHHDEQIVNELMLLLQLQHVVQHLRVLVQDDEHVLKLEEEQQ
jgi:hypothetical protein